MNFEECKTEGATTERLPGDLWRLGIPAGQGDAYRVAQIDDYMNMSRRNFPWQAPLEMRLEARASAPDLPGTWGFGLWNDPFSMGVLAGGRLRLPALPNTAWFFFASPQNYLSLRDDQPGHGQLAAAFRSPAWPSAWMIAGAPAAPLLAWRPTARLLRRLGRRFLQQEAFDLALDPTEWHHYCLRCDRQGTQFWVDDAPVFATRLSPRGRLGLVIWVDNQYMALRPDGRAAYGWLANPEPAWIEVRSIFLQSNA